MKKYLFLSILFTTFFLTTQAQVPYVNYNHNPHLYPYFFPMIDAKLDWVKAEMEQVGGTLQTDTIISPVNKQSYRQLIYSVSDSTKREYPHTGLDIYKAVIYLTNYHLEKKQTCSEYSLWYKS